MIFINYENLTTFPTIINIFIKSLRNFKRFLHNFILKIFRFE